MHTSHIDLTMTLVLNATHTLQLDTTRIDMPISHYMDVVLPLTGAITTR